MSHYSDIGFKLKEKQDILKIFNSIHMNGKLPKRVWETNERGANYIIHYIDDIRYISVVNYAKSEISKLALGYNNDKLSNVKVVERIALGEDNPDFDIIKVEKDGIPFWFNCGNVDIFNFKEGEILDIKIASFADSIEVKNPTPQGFKAEEISLADESYIADFLNDPTRAIVSGVIEDVKIRKNPITKNRFYAVDAKCLGLNLKMLIDETLVKKKELKPGRIISGRFWNSALFFDRDNPDYF